MIESVKGRAISRISTGYGDVVGIIDCMTQVSEAMDKEDTDILKSHIEIKMKKI